MTRWKKFLVAASTGATLVVTATVVASASGTGRDALRSAGAHTVLAASMSARTGQPGGVASGPGLGPIQISIGDRWNLQGPLIVHGTVTLTCGPFLDNSGDDFAQVTVEEALSDKVGHAPASVQLTCDGAHHSYPVTALVSDVPFTSGAPAAVGVQANACGEDTSFQFVCQSGSAVAQVTVR
jgi:hypothetical protein